MRALEISRSFHILEFFNVDSYFSHKFLASSSLCVCFSLKMLRNDDEISRINEIFRNFPDATPTFFLYSSVVVILFSFPILGYKIIYSPTLGDVEMIQHYMGLLLLAGCAMCMGPVVRPDKYHHHTKVKSQRFYRNQLLPMTS